MKKILCVCALGLASLTTMLTEGMEARTGLNQVNILPSFTRNAIAAYNWERVTTPSGVPDCDVSQSCLGTLQNLKGTDPKTCRSLLKNFLFDTGDLTANDALAITHAISLVPAALACTTYLRIVSACKNMEATSTVKELALRVLLARGTLANGVIKIQADRNESDEKPSVGCRAVLLGGVAYEMPRPGEEMNYFLQRTYIADESLSELDRTLYVNVFYVPWLMDRIRQSNIKSSTVIVTDGFNVFKIEHGQLKNLMPAE